MGTGYTRNDTANNIADGNIISASDFDGEFDAIVSAFSTSGHTHDGTAAEGGSITIDAASNQVADAQAGASEEKAMQVAALQSGPLADLSNVVSGLGGKVEYLPVLVSDKSVVDAEVNSLMDQKNN